MGLLARFSPARPVLFEANEFVLYSIGQWFRTHRADVEIVPLAGDVKDSFRLQEVFEAWKPELVFHAAAYKHVPLMEVGNAWQAVRNNILGTYQVAVHAQRHGAERVVLISTDKAVNPTNVLGSTGSVIPKFAEQIAHGGPVTVTDPEINRYFMSIPEAAQLVLQAATMGHGGETFVLDMGEPVKIIDLARNMIRLSGYGDDEIRIEYTGLRPGEKLYEELLADDEHTRETHHPKVRIACNRAVQAGLLENLLPWLQQDGPVSDDDVRMGLKRWVAEYEPARH